MPPDEPSPGPNTGDSHFRWRPLKGLLTCLMLVALGGGMFHAYERTRHQVILRLDDRVEYVHTHQVTVGGLIRELGLSLSEGDIVLPEEHSPLAPGDTIMVQRARSVWIEADGRAFLHRTHRQTVSEILQESEIDVQAYDRIFLDDREVSGESYLPASSFSGQHRGRDAPGRPSVRLSIERAVPLVLHEGGAQVIFYTTAKMVGEALWQAGITLYLGDTVEPELDKPVSAGMHVHLLRSKPILILADGATIKTRTQEKTVAAALAAKGIYLAGKDYSEPSSDTPLRDDLRIHVVRVVEEWMVEYEILPHETVRQADADLEIDHQRIAQGGQDGIRKRRFHITYENGQEISCTLERDWIAQEPQRRIIVYGMRIVLRELQTPEGMVRYWRHFRALATSYTAATSGKTRDDPYYGITRMGWRARKGIIAVDPRVIPLTTNMYVPGYGLGVAGDTGGWILGQRIDLCYDEDNLVLWYKWVDVYLLEPVPPVEKITWILPNWPQEY